MDRLIKGVPGMEQFLRCRDLPSFYRASDIATDKYLRMVIRQTHQSTRAKGLILNSFEDLEGPIMSHVQTKCPNIYSIGPLNAHINIKLGETGSDLSHSNNSLFDVDRSCISWLNAQPPKSVIYVSFGSLAVLKKDELLQFWHGLVDSKTRFLWVIRPDLLTDGEGGEGQVPEELSVATKERGFIVGWVPQEEVLSHKAVGGFLTHSGWNSTLESIVAGVPMLCWPYFADQQINSRYVGEVWKLGIDMKDVCDRKIVEKKVNDLMVEKKDEFTRSTDEMARLARKTVSVGGLSYCNLEKLIKDIRLMSE